MSDTAAWGRPAPTDQRPAPTDQRPAPTDQRPAPTALVAYSGEPGAFAEDAARAYFGPAIATLAVPGFRGVFEAVAGGRAIAGEGAAGERPDIAAPASAGDRPDIAAPARAGGHAVAPHEALAGVVPIENLVNGTVRENYDLLLEFPLEIRGEVVVPVRLCLAALPGQSIDAIERVYSHVQALGQADAFLRRRPWTLLTTYNTAGAGKAIAERGERGAAAVLSPRAAALFGLEVLADGIQSVPDNRTRFLVVARPGATLPEPAPGAVDPSGASRTTLVMGIRNEPGALLRALTVFADHRLNMSKLESRPARDRPWEYVFWVDLDADATAPVVREALADLVAATTTLRILGSYPRGAGG